MISTNLSEVFVLSKMPLVISYQGKSFIAERDSLITAKEQRDAIRDVIHLKMPTNEKEVDVFFVPICFSADKFSEEIVEMYNKGLIKTR